MLLKNKKDLKSWGLYPLIKNTVLAFQTPEKLKEILLTNKRYIPFGNGRSYGDSALSKNIILCRSYNYFLGFDKKTGLLHCQSGVLLSEIIDWFAPKGWFLKITPGTKLITLGGAIASDVHGKNHHTQGCFSECVKEFKLMLPNGKIKTCKKNDELFLATCGGMGLTGIILEAKIYLKKINSTSIEQTVIKTKNLRETFAAFEQYSKSPYSAAWIDCFAKGKNLGKCLLVLGDFANDGNLSFKKKKKLTIPFMFPHFVLNTFTIKIFNWLYYNKQLPAVKHKKVDLDTFFYPLDNIHNWNKIYGRNGFTQYQFILPKNVSYMGLKEILEKIAQVREGSFLAVLKLYGKMNKNYLSFPIEGYSLALDFKINKKVFNLLNQLDKIVLKYGGRVYLSKDVRVSKKIVEQSYPQIKKFRDLRKKYGMSKKFSSLQSQRLKL